MENESTFVLFVISTFLTSVISGLIGVAGGAMLLAIMVLAGFPPAVAIPIHAAVQLFSNISRIFLGFLHIFDMFIGAQFFCSSL